MSGVLDFVVENKSLLLQLLAIIIPAVIAICVLRSTLKINKILKEVELSISTNKMFYEELQSEMRNIYEEKEKFLPEKSDRFRKDLCLTKADANLAMIENSLLYEVFESKSYLFDDKYRNEIEEILNLSKKYFYKSFDETNTTLPLNEMNVEVVGKNNLRSNILIKKQISDYASVIRSSIKEIRNN